jgi:hypothetical protein
MTNLTHTGKIRKPRLLVVHYSADAPPVVESYRPEFLSEYIAAGFRQCLNRAGDECHLLHPQARYRVAA